MVRLSPQSREAGWSAVGLVRLYHKGGLPVRFRKAPGEVGPRSLVARAVSCVEHVYGWAVCAV